MNGLIKFDENKRLCFIHNCLCLEYPLEDINEPCLYCGMSGVDLITVEGLINRTNKAIDLMGSLIDEEDGTDIDVREANLHISEIKLGGEDGIDKIIMQDIQMSDDIRLLSDLVEHMVRVIVYPVNLTQDDFNDFDEDIEFIYDDDDDRWRS